MTCSSTAWYDLRKLEKIPKHLAEVVRVEIVRLDVIPEVGDAIEVILLGFELYIDFFLEGEGAVADYEGRDVVSRVPEGRVGLEDFLCLCAPAVPFARRQDSGHEFDFDALEFRPVVEALDDDLERPGEIGLYFFPQLFLGPNRP